MEKILAGRALRGNEGFNLSQVSNLDDSSMVPFACQTGGA